MDRPRRTPAAAGWAAAIAFVKRPAVVTAEVAAFGVAAAVVASIPQAPYDEEIAGFAARWPRLGAATGALRLHEVSTSGWFLAVVALCLASLVAVQVDQWRRLARLWRAALAPGAFARAPFRAEYPLAGRVPPAPRFTTTGRLGLLGSPTFHLGLVVVVAAALVRLLTFRDGIVRAVEGEVIASAPGAFAPERGGWLSRPLALASPVRIDRIQPEHYPSGALRDLSIRAAVLASGAPEERRSFAVNAPLEMGDATVYVGSRWGAISVLEWRTSSGVEPVPVWLDPASAELRGGARPGGGLEVRMRTGGEGELASAELRVLRDGVLLSVNEVSPGAELPVGAGESLRVASLARWALLKASVDPSRPIFFAGIAIGIVGVVLMLGVARVDEGVFVEGDNVVVALRPHRFAPLYAERFERMRRSWERTS